MAVDFKNKTKQKIAMHYILFENLPTKNDLDAIKVIFWIYDLIGCSMGVYNFLLLRR